MKNTFLLLLIGFCFAIVNAQAPGALDLSFGTAGKVLTSFGSNAARSEGVVLQTDGKILVAGYVQSAITGKDFLCIRYLTDGTPDSTFGVAGIVQLDLQLGSDDVAHALDLQPDGKIVLAGYSDDGSDRDGALVRLQTNGSLDSTFGTNGRQFADLDGGTQDEFNVVKVHPLTGKIIAGGLAVISTNSSKPVVARFEGNGMLDLTFNGTGIRTLWVTSLDYQYYFSLEDLAVQPNGKISAVGWRDFPAQTYNNNYWACRINSDGSMDNTFSTDGVNTYNGGFNGDDRGYAMELLSSGNFMLAGGGDVSSIDYDFSIFEVTGSGSVGTYGNSVGFSNNQDDLAKAVASDASGNWVLAGVSGSPTNSTFSLARFTNAGTLDGGFGSAGKVITTFGNNVNACEDMLIQPDNKIVAVGYSGNSVALARYLGVGGQPDLNGFQLLSPANNSVGQSWALNYFDWSNAFGATGYELELDTTPTFTGTPQLFTTTASNRNVIGFLSYQDYWWRVRATDGVNWGNWSQTWKFKTALATSIDPVVSAEGMTLYPNPAQHQLFVRVPALIGGSIFQIVDMHGRILMAGTLQAGEQVLDVDLLPAGCYALRVEGVAGEGLRWVKIQ